MEDVPLHEVEDDIHSSGHPAGHAVAGECVYAHAVYNKTSLLCFTTVAIIYCHFCASRHFLSNLGSLVDVHVILDSLQGATG